MRQKLIHTISMNAGCDGRTEGLEYAFYGWHAVDDELVDQDLDR